ncbi:hypothetical protein [Ralstonia soli]|uniref:Uncharacterized protein n=1 Tax=Ralstonia soli TaxID=2953896 RepID=A0ABT1AJ46_9RALS|nr:hypothetical protein [Ralstonia soli]MCO5398329.1 hypothetical protein [Ralstonia soli]
MTEEDFKKQATKFVTEAWERIFGVSNTVIANSKLYGFHGIQLIENPNIHQLLSSMGVVSGMLDTIISHLSNPGVDLGPENVRLLLNAKKQVSQLEAVAAALAADDEALYNEEVEKLQNQAAF